MHAVKILASQAGGDGAASCAKEGSTKSSAAKTAMKMPQARIVNVPMRGSVRHHRLAPPANDPELGLQCCIIGLSGANPQGALDIHDENLAVTNLAGACRLHDRINDRVDKTGGIATSILSFGRKFTAYSAPR